MLRQLALVGSTAAVTVAVAIPTLGLASSDAPETKERRKPQAPKAPSHQQVIDQVSRGVVQIEGKVGDEQASGTGFVLDAQKGLIATNAHVVGGMSAMEATLPDGSSGPARLVASSPCDDLAVLQITPSPSLVALPFGSSAAVQAGDDVTAFGFPTSFEAGETQTVSVTDGRVSAVNVRSAPDAGLPDYPSTIQHQAPINPGNSGGPLVDAEGQVVGVNTLRNPEAQGQYYAISADTAKGILEELKTGNSRTDVGLDTIPLSQVPLEDWYTDGADIRADFEEAGLGDALYVLGVRTGSPAAEAEIRAGDVLTSLEGSTTDSVSDVCGTLQSHNAGDRLAAELVVLDSDLEQYGESFATTIELAGDAGSADAALAPQE